MIKIYKDSNANAIFIEDSNGVQFLNSLQATVNSNDITINDLARNIEIVSELTVCRFCRPKRGSLHRHGGGCMQYFKRSI